MSCIYGIGENGGYSSVTPVIHIFIGINVGRICVNKLNSSGSRLDKLFFTKYSRNFMYSVTVKIQLIDPADSRCVSLVNNKMILVIRVLQITERSLITDKFPLTLTDIQCGLDFFGNILRIHIIQQISERCNIKRGSIDSINVIIEGNVTYFVFGKIHFHIETAFKMISAQS